MCSLEMQNEDTGLVFWETEQTEVSLCLKQGQILSMGNENAFPVN